MAIPQLIGHHTAVSASGAFSTFSLDQNTDYVEIISQCIGVDTITHVGFRYGTRTGTPPTYIVSLQGVDASGLPDGTIKGGGSPASQTFTPPADATWNSTFQWVQLANSYACSRGEWLAIVIGHSSGTINGSNYSSFGVSLPGLPGSTSHYAINNDNGSRTRFYGPTFGFKSARQIYGFPIQASSNAYVASNSTPDELGLSFRLPFDAQIVGAEWSGTSPAAGTTYKIILYVDTVELASVTVDTDHQAGNSAGYQLMEAFFTNAVLPLLKRKNRYRLTIQPQSTTGLNPSYWEVSAASDLAAFGGGTDWCYTSRTDAGAWTDTLTRVPLLFPILGDTSQSVAPRTRTLR